MKRFIYIACMVMLLQGCGATTNLSQNTVMYYKAQKSISLAGMHPDEQQGMIIAIKDFKPNTSEPVTIISGYGIKDYQLSTIRQHLIDIGYAPERIYLQPEDYSYDTLKVVFTTVLQWQQHVVPKDPHDQSWYTAKAVTSGFGDSTEYNAAVQHVRIADLSSPRSLGAPNPLAAVGAVERYQKGQVRELGDVSLEAADSGGGM